MHCRQVFGYGPFRADSSVCKAAFFAGVIGEDGGVATLTFGGRASSQKAGKAVLADGRLCTSSKAMLPVAQCTLKKSTGRWLFRLCISSFLTNFHKRTWRLLLNLVYLPYEGFVVCGIVVYALPISALFSRLDEYGTAASVF